MDMSNSQPRSSEFFTQKAQFFDIDLCVATEIDGFRGKGGVFEQDERDCGETALEKERKNDVIHDRRGTRIQKDPTAGKTVQAISIRGLTDRSVNPSGHSCRGRP